MSIVFVFFFRWIGCHLWNHTIFWKFGLEESPRKWNGKGWVGGCNEKAAAPRGGDTFASICPNGRLWSNQHDMLNFHVKIQKFKMKFELNNWIWIGILYSVNRFVWILDMKIYFNLEIITNTRRCKRHSWKPRTWRNGLKVCRWRWKNSKRSGVAEVKGNSKKWKHFAVKYRDCNMKRTIFVDLILLGEATRTSPKMSCRKALKNIFHMVFKMSPCEKITVLTTVLRTIQKEPWKKSPKRRSQTAIHLFSHVQYHPQVVVWTITGGFKSSQTQAWWSFVHTFSKLNVQPNHWESPSTWPWAALLWFYGQELKTEAGDKQLEALA